MRRTAQSQCRGHHTQASGYMMIIKTSIEYWDMAWHACACCGLLYSLFNYWWDWSMLHVGGCMILPSSLQLTSQHKH